MSTAPSNVAGAAEHLAAAPEEAAWAQDLLPHLPRDERGLVDLDATARGLTHLLAACAEQVRQDRRHHGVDSLLDDIAALTHLGHSAEGLRTLRISQVAHAERQVDLATGQEHTVHHREGWTAEHAPDELAPVLAIPPTSAGRLLEESLDAVHRTPRLLDLVIAGGLSPAAVRAVARELIEAPGDTCREVERRLLQQGVTDVTPGRLRQRTRRLVQEIDPPAERSGAHRRARSALGVWLEPGAEAGTSDVHAVLPAHEAQRLYAAIDEHARALCQTDATGASLGQCRAKALLDLALHGVRVDTVVHLLVPVEAGEDAVVAPPVAEVGSAVVRRPDGAGLARCGADDFVRSGVTGVRSRPGAAHEAPPLPGPHLVREHRPLRHDELHPLPGTDDPGELRSRRWLLRCVDDGSRSGSGSPHVSEDRRDDDRAGGHPAGSHRGGERPAPPPTGLRDLVQATDSDNHPTERHRWCHRCDRFHPRPVDPEQECPSTRAAASTPATATTG